MGDRALLDIAPWLFPILAAEFVNGWTDAPNTNDGQKFIGAFTLALVLGGILPAFQVPAWAIVLLFLATSVITALAALIVVIRLPADRFMEPCDRRRAMAGEPARGLASAHAAADPPRQAAARAPMIHGASRALIRSYRPTQGEL